MIRWHQCLVKRKNLSTFSIDENNETIYDYKLKLLRSELRPVMPRGWKSIVIMEFHEWDKCVEDCKRWRDWTITERKKMALSVLIFDLCYAVQCKFIQIDTERELLGKLFEYSFVAQLLRAHAYQCAVRRRASLQAFRSIWQDNE